jgi:hypothetical protein
MKVRTAANAWVVVALLTGGCATTLVPGAAKVRVLHDSSAVNDCVAVGNIEPHPDTPGYSDAEARNMTVEIGGNTFLVTYQSLGSLVSGVAYRCP